jgi:hypothetical protein
MEFQEDGYWVGYVCLYGALPLKRTGFLVMFLRDVCHILLVFIIGYLG